MTPQVVLILGLTFIVAFVICLKMVLNHIKREGLNEKNNVTDSSKS